MGDISTTPFLRQGSTTTDPSSSSSGCDCEKQNCPQDVQILFDESSQSPDFLEFMEEQIRNYQLERRPNARISLEGLSSLQELQERMRTTGNDDSDWDGTFFPTRLLGSILAPEDDAVPGAGGDSDDSPFSLPLALQRQPASALLDLSRFVRSSSELDWAQVLPYYRRVQSYYNSQRSRNNLVTHSIPLVSSEQAEYSTEVVSMYYRKDLLEEFNRPVPRTWQEYIDTAAFFHERALGPGQAPLFGSCVNRMESCHNDNGSPKGHHPNAVWAFVILATMTQSQGTSTGFLLDPNNQLEPLLGAALQETLRILAEQVKYGHPQELTATWCQEATKAFAQGRCALSLHQGSPLDLLADIYDDENDNSIDASNIGVAPAPGSTVVLDRATEKLVSCDASNCPFAENNEALGLVNRSPFVPSGGWAGAVSNNASPQKQDIVADFFAFVSSKGHIDATAGSEKNKTGVEQAYRYAHSDPSYWASQGVNTELALAYSESSRAVNSENAVLDLQTADADTIKQVVDANVYDYLFNSLVDVDMSDEALLEMQAATSRSIEQEMRDTVLPGSVVNTQVLQSYQQSLGLRASLSQTGMNHIDTNFRDAGWGLSGLMCIAALGMIVWTLLNRNNQVMKAFQPFLLIQASVGLFLLAAAVIPLGFDDSYFDASVLDRTCMIAPWLYICGYTIFFSSVYSKIRECIKIFRMPHEANILKVEPKDSFRMCFLLLWFNCLVLALWTGLDPLQWVREERAGGEVMSDGSIESYGVCRGGTGTMVFVSILFVFNITICINAALQAFKCRFLVLEYNEMQWLPLSVFPFVEVWLVGGPIVYFVQDKPSILFCVLATLMLMGGACAALAVFAPKDWYIRKFKNSGTKRNSLKRSSSAGILVLKHPTVESQKQVLALNNALEVVQGMNTELEIDIRVMKDKFKELTTTEKQLVRESILRENMDEDANWGYRDEAQVDFEQAAVRRSNEAGLQAMHKFQQVWEMQYEDDEEESSKVPVPVPGSLSRDNSLASFKDVMQDDRSSSDGSHGSSTNGGIHPLYKCFEEPGVESAPTSKRSVLFSDGASSRGAPGSVNDDSMSILEPPPTPSSVAERSVLSTTPPATAARPVLSPTPSHATEASYPPPLPSSATDISLPPPPPSSATERSMLSSAQNSRADRLGVSPTPSSATERSQPPPIQSSATERSVLRAPSLAAGADGEDDSSGYDPPSETSRGSDYIPEDPLEKLARMFGDTDDESGGGMGSSRGERESSEKDSEEAIDTSQFLRDDVSDTSRGSDYVPEDPLAKLARMFGGEGSDSNRDDLPTSPNQQEAIVAADDDSTDMPPVSAVARMLAHGDMHVTSRQNEDTNSTGSHDQDANLEPTGIPFDQQYDNPSDSEESDVIIKKKDFRDLDSMIKMDDLDALEDKIARLATSVKQKLTDSTLADLSQDHIGEVSADTSHVYVIPFGIAKRDESQGGLGSLDLSRISAQGDENFVRVSDSILEKSHENGGLSVGGSSSHTTGSKGSRSIPVTASTGESTAPFPETKPPLSPPNYDAVYSKQNAGEPSQGEVRVHSTGDRKSGEFFNGVRSPNAVNEAVSPEFDSNGGHVGNVSNTSYTVGDWSAAGITASLLADWSDSASTSSYAESYTESLAESTSSLEAITKASPLDAGLAKRLDRLVEKMDFDGVAQAVERFHEVERSMEDGVSLVAEKRRKKRQLEAARLRKPKSKAMHR